MKSQRKQDKHNKPEVISCECGRKLTKWEWNWLQQMYGEHPYCGCSPCSVCNKFSSFDDLFSLTKVVDEDAGLTGAVFFLCPDCLKETSE